MLILLKGEQMKQKLKKILETKGFLPIKSNWNGPITIDTQGDEPRNNERTKIKEEINKKSKGIYIYYKYETQDKPVYIGEGKLLDRLINHYDITFRKLSSDRSGMWHIFWSTHKHKYDIYWKKCNDDRNRLIIEEALHNVLGSKFNDWKPRFYEQRLISEIKRRFI